MKRTEKTCFKCGTVKPLSDFYKHPMMLDGHLNKCKECTKKDVALNYRNNITHYIEYEKLRFKTAKRKEQAGRYQRKQRAEDPVKKATRYATSNAIRDGRLTRQPCEKCGDFKSEAHHTDYTDPLTVMWLCRKHHLEQHGKQSYADKYAETPEAGVAS